MRRFKLPRIAFCLLILALAMSGPFAPFVGASFAQDGETANQDDQLAADVRDLMRDLRDGSVAEADAAEAKLLEIGPKVLDLLPEPNDQMSANVKQRLARVREQLELRRAESVSAASLVTLSGKMKLADALAKLEEATENHVYFFQDEAAGNREMEFDYEAKPFMEVMDDIMDRAQLTTYGFAPDPGMALMARAETETPRSERIATYPGPFRVEATEVMSQRSIRNSMDRRMEVSLDLSWEPRLRPVVAEMSYSNLTIKDQNGNPIEVSGMGQPTYEIGEDTSAEFHIPLALPDRSVTTISEFSGSIDLLVPGRLETFEFEDLEKAQRPERRSAGVTVVLDRVRKNSDVWEFRILVRFEQPQGALQSHRNWVINNPVMLVGPDGSEVEFDSAETSARTGAEVGMKYYFDLPKGPAGYKLVYKTPTTILSLPVSFTLKDIPLP